jgi:hypothetical protein
MRGVPGRETRWLPARTNGAKNDFALRPHLLGLAEGEVISPHTRVKKLNPKLAIDDRLWLTNRLVEPRLCNRAVALAVNIDPMRIAGRFPIDRHAESGDVSTAIFFFPCGCTTVD